MDLAWEEFWEEDWVGQVVEVQQEVTSVEVRVAAAALPVAVAQGDNNTLFVLADEIMQCV